MLKNSRTHLDRWHQNVNASYTAPAFLGVIVLVLVVAGFGAWAATAELSSAAVARGSFIATGQNKEVQHLEGGIIKAILVEEGDLVEAGQALVLLDDTAARSERERLRLRMITHLVMNARLSAEIEGAEEIILPDTVKDVSGNPEIAAIIESQRNEFAARNEKLEGQVRVSRDRIKAIRQEIGGLSAQKTALEKQLDLIEEEAESSRELLEKGLAKRPQYLALKRKEASLEGQIGKLEADIGRATERISETESEILLARSRHREEAVTAYRDSQGRLDDIRERLKAAEDILRRHRIVAPVRGVIVALHYHTEGGVVGAGQTILELLPAEDELLIEARIRPEDVDVVREGLPAQVRLVALDQRVTPLVEGTVTHVSADAMEDERREAIYYLARIELNEDALVGTSDLQITPGMPVEVYVKTGERTFFEYLLKPIMESTARAFKET